MHRRRLAATSLHGILPVARRPGRQPCQVAAFRRLEGAEPGSSRTSRTRTREPTKVRPAGRTAGPVSRTRFVPRVARPDQGAKPGSSRRSHTQTREPNQVHPADRTPGPGSRTRFIPPPASSDSANDTVWHGLRHARARVRDGRGRLAVSARNRDERESVRNSCRPARRPSLMLDRPVLGPFAIAHPPPSAHPAISSRSPSSSSMMETVRRVSVVHGTNLSGVGHLPVLPVGLNQSAISIASKTGDGTVSALRGQHAACQPLEGAVEPACMASSR